MEGRSISSFDLHAGLAACAGHLERFGGHRAAAGLSIRPECVELFAEAFASHADGALTDDDLRPRITIDAVLPRGTPLTLQLSEELGRLAPFGLGNPEVTLLAPGCRLVELGTVGEGKHLAFRVRRDGRDAGRAIGFGLGRQLDLLGTEGRYDVAFRLEPNRWNGTIAPQLVVRRLFEADDRYDDLHAWLARLWRAGEQAWTAEARAIFAELDLAEADSPGRRHLLESETFRALLAEPALARAA